MALPGRGIVDMLDFNLNLMLLDTRDSGCTYWAFSMQNHLDILVA